MVIIEKSNTPEDTTLPYFMTLTLPGYILLVPSVYITEYLFSIQVKKKWFRSYLIITFNRQHETIFYKIKYRHYSQAIKGLLDISKDVPELALEFHKSQDKKIVEM